MSSTFLSTDQFDNCMYSFCFIFTIGRDLKLRCILACESHDTHNALCIDMLVVHFECDHALKRTCRLNNLRNDFPDPVFTSFADFLTNHVTHPFACTFLYRIPQRRFC